MDEREERMRDASPAPPYSPIYDDAPEFRYMSMDERKREILGRKKFIEI